MHLSRHFSQKTTRAILGLLLIPMTFSPAATLADDYLKATEAWRTERAARLNTPDGWLSLIGLYWLQLGENSVGAAQGNSLQLAAGPAHFGSVLLAPNGSVTLTPEAAAKVEIDGKAITGSTTLKYGEGKPTLAKSGTVSFFVIKRGDKLGLRVKDTDSPRRRHFVGLDWYPVDPAWRVEATWVPYSPVHEIKITNVLGQTSSMPVPGKAVFNHEGHTYELIPVEEGPEEPLFFIMADATSGVETYGASRFLYAERAKDGKVVLDFNRVQNPPCAFTPFATCPLPPKENRLPFPVLAGEKNYRGEHH